MAGRQCFDCYTIGAGPACQPICVSVVGNYEIECAVGVRGYIAQRPGGVAGGSSPSSSASGPPLSLPPPAPPPAPGSLYQWHKATPDYLASLPDGGIFEYKLELEGRFYITPPSASLWALTAGECVILEGRSSSSSMTPRSPVHC